MIKSGIRRSLSNKCLLLWCCAMHTTFSREEMMENRAEISWGAPAVDLIHGGSLGREEIPHPPCKSSGCFWGKLLAPVLSHAFRWWNNISVLGWPLPEALGCGVWALPRLRDGDPDVPTCKHRPLATRSIGTIRPTQARLLSLCSSNSSIA